MGLKEPRRRVNAAHEPLSSESFPWLKKGFLCIWERWFRAYRACFILTGITALRLQHKTASVVFLAVFQSGSLKWGWRTGGERRGRGESCGGRCCLLPIPTPAEIYTAGNLRPRYPKHWSYEPNHSVLPLQSMERMRGMPKRDEPSLRVSSSRGEPRPCYLLSLNQKLTITSLSSLFLFPACGKNFGLFLSSSILLCLAWGEKGKGSFLMGSWSKWIIARPFFSKASERGFEAIVFIWPLWAL